jgi:hypothetical protein
VEPAVSAIVLLIGAGASVSDVSTASLRSRPPLDRGFFGVARRFEPTLTQSVADYMARTYEVGITRESEDYLERVMAAIYTDVYNPALRDEATLAFHALLKLFTARLAFTTNAIAATTRRHLYRIVTTYLAKRCRPEEITIITFNQDLQVEKMLEHITKAARWAHVAEDVWRFPYCYRLGDPELGVTRPTSPSSTAATFREAAADGPCIEVLKLHGSLNWYSTHNSSQPTPKAMFNQSRQLRITARVNIPKKMTLTKQKKLYLLPVIVPPVSHKSAVLHDRLHGVWDLAERRLTAADEIIVFGYSCPPLDFESTNLLRRSQRDEAPARRISIIDPNPDVVSRYTALMTPTRLRYYPAASYFLSDTA